MFLVFAFALPLALIASCGPLIAAIYLAVRLNGRGA